jgi:hypothetical protein
VSTRVWRLRREPTVLLVAAVIAVPVIVWAVVRITASDDDLRPGDLAGDPGVSHVHGLGINPADGSLVIATHYGSFKLSTDSEVAERIGDSFQDTMGFTIAGPDHFLGSGHPDVAGMRAGQPGRLGLIESSDAGTTWTSLSLSGEVDFHALAFAHDQVYGWDSGTGRFMVSADQDEWETRSTLDLFGFAVDPDDPDHLLAATPSGPIESDDGGRTWEPADGPQLVALSWDVDAGLFGADNDGTVWYDDVSGWEEVGRLPGAPQAMLATSDALYAAAHDDQDVTGIYRSIDNGRTWQLRYQDTQQ